VSNAIKFKDDSKYECWVKLSVVEESDNKVTIEFRDNGIGINKDQFKKVFKPFYRGHNSLSGHGLGLYIVHSMMKVLEGEVTIDSTPQVGTTVQVCLLKSHK
jgi:signal transduction histidine kinase